MKKAIIVFLVGLLVVTGAVCWEYIFDRQNQEHWMARFEKHLHHTEAEADRILAELKDGKGFDRTNWDEDVIFVAFKNGNIFFWTNEIVGMDGLYDRLNTTERFIKINNTYYEVRRSTDDDIEYFALLHIKDNYPYTNQYVKNRLGKFLGIGAGNTENVQISPFFIPDGAVVKDKEGNALFYLQHTAHYKDRTVNYVLLTFYILFFFILFYVYDRLLKSTASLRNQLIYIFGFILFLFLLRHVMVTWQVPDSIYRLRIFEQNIAKGEAYVSVGDVMLVAFSIVQILYISFANLRINYISFRVRHWRYVIVPVFLIVVFVCMLFLNYVIRSLIENTDVYLNIARIADIDVFSFIAFVSILLGGMGLIVIIDSSVIIFKNLISWAMVQKIVGGGMLIFAGGCYLADSYIDVGGCIFVWLIYWVAIVNRYRAKRDVQRSIYLITLFMLSVYVVLVTQRYEQYRELTQRAGYATELIEERDYNFEKKLVEISKQINDSEVIADLVAGYNEEFLKMCLTNDLLDLNGYNYISEIILCRAGDSIYLEAEKEAYNCDVYFRQLIHSYGIQIGHSNFYVMNEFDGLISYIGSFVFGDVTLYLRFDSTKDNEGHGYPQILSRKSVDGESAEHDYSYAKYKKGKLIFSSGSFNYYKTLDRFERLSGSIDIQEKDSYSHMIIPVDDNGVLVVSLDSHVYSLYYINILYAFLICILFSSYGILFNADDSLNLKKDTLKARIKNSIISLVFTLFVILTVLSIYLNVKSSENRHNAKATELLRYINKELEKSDDIEYRQNPEIIDILAEMSDVLAVDINIYSLQGELVATSRPEIFSAGFDGYLIHARAREAITKGQMMSYIDEEHIGELKYMSAYMPLMLDNGKNYIINVPYFTQNDELNLDIVITVVIAINIAVVVMVLAFILSGIVAERVTKPLSMVNDKLKQMRIGGKNEKIEYEHRDEVGGLVREYNNMVEKLEASVNQLAKSERESAWREMATQIAHEIKNPLTPMKLNIQFMQRSLQIEDPVEFKKRFKDISAVLIEQIDSMASTASAFSDFARIPVSQSEVFDISEMVGNCVRLFETNVDSIMADIEPHIQVYADKEQMQRVLVNILKNAVQSIPEDRKSEIVVSVHAVEENAEIRIRDNGVGIPEENRVKVFEPNFTTKTSGTGLGLAISRRIMESMGGSIDFVNLAIGVDFVVILKRIKSK